MEADIDAVVVVAKEDVVLMNIVTTVVVPDITLATVGCKEGCIR